MPFLHNETLGADLAAANASLNGLSSCLLLAGFVAIRSGRKLLHQRLMLSAFVVSGVFLVCYLIRVAVSGTHRYEGTAPFRAVYLVLLGTHMLLAAVTPVLAIRAIWLGLKARWPEHRRLVRYAWPIWMYVSVTGVLVYLMLYQLRW